MGPQSRKEREVWQACESLVAEGELLSYQAIGERLQDLGYRRGSNSDIHRYLKTYKEHEPSVAIDTEGLQLKKQLALLQTQYHALERAHNSALKLLGKGVVNINIDPILQAIREGFQDIPNTPAAKAQKDTERENLSRQIAQLEADHKAVINQLKGQLSALEKQLVSEQAKRQESEKLRQLAYLRLKELTQTPMYYNEK